MVGILLDLELELDPAKERRRRWVEDEAVDVRCEIVSEPADTAVLVGLARRDELAHPVELHLDS
jgi:hypothetical protein